jgi:histidinol phosphatase-like PHP family hydrolase
VGTGSLINLHTHTRFSDGDFRPDELISRAHSDGLTHLAITDHFSTVKVHSLQPFQLEEYKSLLRDLGKRHDGTRVLAGVEVDTNPSRCDLWDLPFDEMNGLDLLLFEYVGDEGWGGIDLEGFEELRSQFKTPCGLAHTDISRVFSQLTPDELADALRSMKVFVEVNTAFLYKREGRYYFELAQDYYRKFRGRVRVSMGTDTHHTLSEVSNIRRGYRFLEGMGLMDDLLL